MTDSIKLKLQQIIDKSQELVSLLDFLIDNDISNESNTEKSDAENLSIDNKKICDIQNQRSELISLLFNEYPRDKIVIHSTLLNEIFHLDKLLIIKSSSLKQHFASQLIKLKKGKKSTKAYQNF